MHRLALPLLVLLFASLSIITLQSIYPSGVPSQLLAFVLGGGAYIGAYSISFSFWKKVVPVLFIIITVLLVGTFILGKTTKGSTRWIAFGSMQVQPSQLAKPLLLLYLCGVLVKTSKKQIKTRVVPLAFAVLPIILVFIQPDLGTAMILSAGCIASLYFSNVSFKYLSVLSVLVVFVAVTSWSFLLRDYQKQRILTFLSPTEDQLGQGYHASQAIIAVGSGKLTGRGLGHGVQSNLRFLPERQTDFLFASYAEELGFIGVLFLFFLYIVFFTLIASIASRVKDPVGYAYSWSFISLLFVQTAMNLGMNLGILPIAGVTLPFMSLGGSSVIAILFGLGLLSSAYRANPRRHLVEIHSFV